METLAVSGWMPLEITLSHGTWLACCAAKSSGLSPFTLSRPRCTHCGARVRPAWSSVAALLAIDRCARWTRDAAGRARNRSESILCTPILLFRPFWWGRPKLAGPREISSRARSRPTGRGPDTVRLCLLLLPVLTPLLHLVHIKVPVEGDNRMYIDKITRWC